MLWWDKKIKKERDKNKKKHFKDCENYKPEQTLASHTHTLQPGTVVSVDTADANNVVFTSKAYTRHNWSATYETIFDEEEDNRSAVDKAMDNVIKGLRRGDYA